MCPSLSYQTAREKSDKITGALSADPSTELVYVRSVADYYIDRERGEPEQYELYSPRLV